MEVTSLKYPNKDTDVMFKEAKLTDYGIVMKYLCGTREGTVYFVTDTSDTVFEADGYTIVEIADSPFSTVQVIYYGISRNDQFLIEKAVRMVGELYPGLFKKDNDTNYLEYPEDYMEFDDLCIRSDMVYLSSGPNLFLN